MKRSTLPVVLSAAMVLCLPGAFCETPDTVERLQSPTTLDLHAIAWRPVPADSYALIAGTRGALLQYTGRFFINLSPDVNGSLNGVDWHPSGSHALVVGDDGTVLDFDGQAFRSLPQNLTQPVTCIAWRPDGRQAFLCGDFPFVVRYDPQAGTFQRLDTGSDQYFLRFAAWRPDGGSAIVMGTLGVLFRYDGTNFVSLNSPTANQWLAASWSPDNRTALLSARGGLLFSYTEGASNLTAISTNTTSSINCIAYYLNGSFAIGAGEGGLVIRYPSSVVNPPNPPDGDGEGAMWLLISATVLLAVSAASMLVAVLMVHRARKKADERRELEDAEAHAVELAMAKKRV